MLAFLCIKLFHVSKLLVQLAKLRPCSAAQMFHSFCCHVVITEGEDERTSHV